MTPAKRTAKPRARRTRTPAPTPAEPKLYKILVAGKSCHGGDLMWSLPVDGRPGEWHEVDGTLDLCRRGLHVTRGEDVVAWVIAAIDGAGGSAAEVEIYECEAGDERTEYSTINGAGKLAARRARLLRRVTDHAELAALGVYLSGTHDVRDRRAAAYGSATVAAYGSATVTAYGSATVIRWASAVRVSTIEHAVLVDRSGGYDAPAVTYTTPHETHPTTEAAR